MKQAYLIIFFNLLVNYVFAEDIRVGTVGEIYESVSRLKPGDRLLLKNGRYNDLKLVVTVSGNDIKPIIIAAENTGKVFFTGNVRVEMRGEHLVLKGIYFKDGARDVTEWKSHGPGLVAIYGSYNRVTECLFNDFDKANSAYITTSLTDDGSVPLQCRIDHCSFVNKLTFDQVINLNNTFKKDTVNGGPPMYHRIDHCFFSNPKKEGNAGGGIRIGYFRNDVGRCLVDSNVFERQDSEPEIITGKSQENIYYANTFLNCRGTLNFRHGDKQAAVNNFFISNDTLFEYGGMFIWGSSHLIANNYFNLSKTIRSRGHAAIYLNPGAPASEHAMAFDIEIINNIFENINGYAIHFSPMLANRVQYFPHLKVPQMVPHDIRLINNCFYADKPSGFKFFRDDCPTIEKKINWANNSYYGLETGLAINNGLRKGQKHRHLLPFQKISDVSKCIALKNETHFAYRNFDGIDFDFNCKLSGGINGKPLRATDILPSWMMPELGTYHKAGKLTKLQQKRLREINHRNKP